MDVLVLERFLLRKQAQPKASAVDAGVYLGELALD